MINIKEKTKLNSTETYERMGLNIHTHTHTYIIQETMIKKDLCKCAFE